MRVIPGVAAPSSVRLLLALAAAAYLPAAGRLHAGDHIRELQAQAVAQGRADWGHWGTDPGEYTGWSSHTNRLIPLYTYGLTLDAVSGEHSVYRDADGLARLYGQLPDGTLNRQAEYCDQTDVYCLQKQAVEAGKKYLVLIVFDGMDWQTIRAAAVSRSGRVGYREGRGTGLDFQDYRGAESDFGYFVTSPHNDGTTYGVDTQTVGNPGGLVRGGYDARLGGENPWTAGLDPTYLICQCGERKHAYTDSASSATSMTAGIKTYNDSINVDSQGRQVAPIARELQGRGFAIGVVTSVPISHATPAAAYANNVSRDDYQDLTRDLVGLPSVAHADAALPGVDVLIGAGWGTPVKNDSGQGANFVAGNKYLTAEDLARIDQAGGGPYVVCQRAAGQNGSEALAAAARQAADGHKRLLGYFGVASGHLPFRTADGGYDPAPGRLRIAEPCSQADVHENPTLADMTAAALKVLDDDADGFWLMVEAGDVDWANHDNNIDNSIGAVISGDDAFRVVADWAESHDCWDETAVILTADHGHYLVLDHPEALIAPAPTVK